VAVRAALAGACVVLLAGTEEAPAGLAANYHHNARVSLPNYLAMTSGSTLLRTTERVLGIRRCLGKACSARGLSKAFRL